MATIQEFAVHDPTMMIDRFFVEIPAGGAWQAWRQELSHGDRLEVFCEDEQRWLVATVHTWRGRF